MVKSKTSGLTQIGTYEMQGNVEAGLKKIWLRNSFLAEKNEFIEITCSNSAGDDGEKESNHFVVNVSHDMFLIRKEGNCTNGLELQFTEKASKFVCAIYYTLA